MCLREKKKEVGGGGGGEVGDDKSEKKMERRQQHVQTFIHCQNNHDTQGKNGSIVSMNLNLSIFHLFPGQVLESCTTQRSSNRD